MSLMPVDEALTKLLSGVKPLETEYVPLEGANGRYLSAPLFPPEPNRLSQRLRWTATPFVMKIFPLPEHP